MGVRAFMPAITRSSSYWSEETILSANACVWKSCYPIEGQVTFKDEYAVIFLSIKFHSLFICKWYDPVINIPINWIYFDEWEGSYIWNNYLVISILLINYNIANAGNRRVELAAKGKVTVPTGMLIGMMDHVWSQDILEKGPPKWEAMCKLHQLDCTRDRPEFLTI